MWEHIRTRNITLLIILLLLFLPFPIYSLTAGDSATYTKEEQYKMALSISEKQAPASRAARKILAAMDEGLDNSQKYLDTYGGMYLDFKGNLYVVITEYTQAVMDQYRGMADGFKNIIFVRGKYSYNELSKMKEEILAFCKKTPTNVFSVGISNSGNAINIAILSDKAIGDKDVVKVEEKFAGYPIRITKPIDGFD